MSTTTAEHRWSGWPGAWCLDCGQPDPAEEGTAHGCVDFMCLDCGESQPSDPTESCKHANVLARMCPEHQETECPEPGSHRHDPYWVAT